MICQLVRQVFSAAAWPSPAHSNVVLYCVIPVRVCAGNRANGKQVNGTAVAVEGGRGEAAGAAQEGRDQLVKGVQQKACLKTGCNVAVICAAPWVLLRSQFRRLCNSSTSGKRTGPVQVLR